MNTTRIAAPETTTVPGFPATDLKDEKGPWQQAMRDAQDLGADTQSFDTRLATTGLRAPTALLGKEGWHPLWQRAHR